MSKSWFSFKLWWADPNLPLRESREERFARLGIWIPGTILTIVLVLLGKGIGRSVGMDEHLTVLVEGLIVWPCTMAAWRIAFGTICPTLMKKADENAMRRIRRTELGSQR